ncbi:MAG: iron ABC transporter permease [Cyanobacteria bacterium]|nr:iron ABC transporter permease [Cyanobacteriota bacterium]
MVLFRFLLLLAIAVLTCLANVTIGEVTIEPAVVLKALFDQHSLNSSQLTDAGIIWDIRLPRLVVALIVGTCLSISGFILQALSRNQLADPYLTGVSSGAGVAVACAIAMGMGLELIPVAAFCGGLAASLIVASMARGPAGLSITKLLLAGIALSTICGGVITLIITSGGDAIKSQGIFFWLAGGISGRTWSEAIPSGAYTVVGFLLSLLLSKQIRLLSLGSDQAKALGMNVDRTQWILLSISVLLCGAAVSVSGIVGFVGLVAPHVARKLFGRDERLHIVSSALIGMILVATSDLAARTLVAGEELPLGTLMSLIGGPFFLWLVARHRGESW